VQQSHTTYTPNQIVSAVRLEYRLPPSALASTAAEANDTSTSPHTHTHTHTHTHILYIVGFVFVPVVTIDGDDSVFGASCAKAEEPQNISH